MIADIIGLVMMFGFTAREASWVVIAAVFVLLYLLFTLVLICVNRALIQMFIQSNKSR